MLVKIKMISFMFVLNNILMRKMLIFRLKRQQNFFSCLISQAIHWHTCSRCWLSTARCCEICISHSRKWLPPSHKFLSFSVDTESYTVHHVFIDWKGVIRLLFCSPHCLSVYVCTWPNQKRVLQISFRSSGFQ